MQKIWLGIFWKILSCGCFAGINALVRFLSGGSPIALDHPLPIYTIMFFQNIIAVLIISSWMMSNKTLQYKNFVTKKPWLHLIRVVTAAIGIGLWYISLRYIPVVQVVALSLIGPIITTVGAVLFLKEKFNLQCKIAILLSLIGGFLMARPDQTLINASSYSWLMLLPLLAAFVFALDKLLTRRLLAANESPSSLAWLLVAFISPLCILPAMYYGWVSPNLEHIPWLLLLGALNGLAHFTFNKAYALTEVTVLLPFGAAKLILSAIISYMVFYEAPRTLDMWSGIGIIVLSTIVLAINQDTIKRIQRLFKVKQAVPVQ
jgi:drug/metabolite transporter (DMT)-like permease